MDKTLTEFMEKINSGEVFFFAGSGISYNSGMPSAGKIVQKTAEIFLPAGEEYKTVITRIIKNIQPEVLYENLLYLTGSIECLRLWSVLSPHLLDKYSQQALPNINHFFIVEYSVRNGVPIITTNFDTLFENAAEKLGYSYEVILPYTPKEKDVVRLFKESKINNQTAYIFKVHGTIELENIESLDTLYTTMSTISRANFEMLNFIESLCRSKHITFVGYSGKDVDYFPEIKKRIANKIPYWVNEFNQKDDGTYANSEAIGAIRINMYPDKVFKEDNLKKNQNFAKAYTVIQQTSVIQDDKIFDDLQKSIKNNIKWDEYKSIFFFSLLCKEIGEYKFAFKKLKELHYEHKFSDIAYQIGMLLYLSKLAHENSKFETCHSYAKQALIISKTLRKETSLIPYEIIARSLISESKRMLIAHDTIYSNNFNIIPFIFAIISFVLTKKKLNNLYRKIKQQKVIEIWATHEIIEHKIRLIALLQAFFIAIFNKAKGWLIEQWEAIRQESFNVGYSHGIANTWKYQMRLTKKISEMDEGKRIYDMTTAATGQGLLVRNQAEIYFENGNYNEAKDLFYNTSVQNKFYIGSLQ